jgi:four helix bundle protein
MATTREAVEELPKGFAFLAEQLRKSTSSVSRNFAEGYYYSSRAQQRRYFGYAIQSARESSASFDTARSFRVCGEETIVRGKALALDIVKILSKWAR